MDMDETVTHLDSATEKTFYRPYLAQFLRNVSKQWQVMVFTASFAEYADKVLD